MLKIVMALTGLAASASAAMAADIAVDVAVPAPPLVPVTYDWSGWYAGGDAGYLWGGFNGNIHEPGLSGLDAGAQLHYNAVLSNNWVLSPFVAVTLPVQKSEIFGIDVNVNWALQGGVRLGYAHDRWLPYVYGGGVIGAAHAEADWMNETHTHTGFIVGAGFEYAIAPSWTVGARYAYYSLGKQHYDAPGMDVGWQGHSVLGTISFASLDHGVGATAAGFGPPLSLHVVHAIVMSGDVDFLWCSRSCSHTCRTQGATGKHGHQRPFAIGTFCAACRS